MNSTNSTGSDSSKNSQSSESSGLSAHSSLETDVSRETSVSKKVREIYFIESSLSERLNGQLSGREVLELESVLDTIPPESEYQLSVSVWILTDHYLKEHAERIARWQDENPRYDVKMILLASTKEDKSVFAPVDPACIHLTLPGNTEPEMLGEVADNAYHMMVLRYEKLKLQSRLALSYQDIRRITRVGQAMATERDFEALIELILQSAREMVSADGGSIYVIERKSGGESPTHLRFKKSALNLQAGEFLLSIDNNSMAGYCALMGRPMSIDDVYALTGEEDYHFNNEFDRAHSYYTKSMMLIPMKNYRDEVIGVIQLINRKRNFKKKLTLEELKGDEVRSFTHKDMELVSALAGQAAVAIQNSLLLQDINNLFEGFVKASVTAIEQRDPTTSGHSFRVAEFTVGLAQAVDRLSGGRHAHVSFSPEQIRELRYASLLHDFGKVGVQEKVLVKAKKLYSDELELIHWRFRYIRKAIEKDYLQKKLRYIKENGVSAFEDYEKFIDAERETRLIEIEEMHRTIMKANEPSVVEAGNFDKLGRISRHKIRMDDGLEVPFLKENELISLSIRRGNLDQRERMEIESHVSHTYRFLVQIPWTGDLSRVPDIARGHHEKLDGSGYPLGLQGHEIALQTRMMTISDIYDALTAPDRPYKKSLKPDLALDILRKEAKDNHVDESLLDIFIESHVFKKVYEFQSARV